MTMVPPSSLVYFEFNALELNKGTWTTWRVASAGHAALSIFCQFYTPWRTLQLGGDRPDAHAVTTRFSAAAFSGERQPSAQHGGVVAGAILKPG